MELTQQTLKSVLAYDAETGLFRYLSNRGRQAKKGSIAGYNHEQGYVRIKIKGVQYYAHRLAWLYVYGEFPQKLLDHINGVTSDNRIANLRLATQAQNMGNSRKPINNTTGFKGVCFHKQTGKFVAHISMNNKLKSLGYFKTAEDAHKAYVEAAKRLHGDFARFD